MSSTRSMLTIVALLSVFVSTADANDPNPLQDVCVGHNNSEPGVGSHALFVNGRLCKDPETVTADDFFLSGFNEAGDVTNALGSAVTRAQVLQLPGVNTQGIGISRVDYGLKGLRPPHLHPRASEIIHVAQGKLYAGFISSNPSNPNDNNKLYAKILGPGDVYCFPRGLIHFHSNIGDTRAVAFTTFSSQNPGVLTLARGAFGSYPQVNPDLLATSFQLNITQVEDLQSKDWKEFA